MKINTCPHCGKSNLKYDGRKMDCPDCGFVFYNNTAAAVAVLIRFENELFFTVRNKNPQKGKLDLAGGFVDFFETGEQAAVRELHEELSINIVLPRLKYLKSLPNIYEYKGIEYHTLDLFYEYSVSKKFTVTLEKEEIADYLWIDISDLKLTDLAFESQRRFFQEYLQK